MRVRDHESTMITARYRVFCRRALNGEAGSSAAARVPLGCLHFIQFLSETLDPLVFPGDLRSGGVEEARYVLR